MQVESYECQEVAAEPAEISEEAARLIAECGLEGQQALYQPKTPEKTAGRVPYRRMTAEEEFVFKQLCPQTTPAKQYRDDAMPLRVLEIVAHAQSLDFFESVVVWHRESVNVQDPVLVGIHVPDPKANWTKHNYILARWAEALDEWPALVKQALGTWRKIMLGKVGALVRQAQQDYDLLQNADDIPLANAAKYDTPYYHALARILEG